MLTTRIVDENTPNFDNQINDFIQSQSFDGSGNKMIIGIENDNKDVYRVIEVTGLGDFINTVEFLTELHLTDILFDSTKMVDGYDARFRI